MILQRFNYIEPRSMEEALSLLADNKGETFVVSGGTEVFVQMKQRLLSPDRIIGLTRIPGIDTISYSEETGLHIGPGVTQFSLSSHSLINRAYPGLAEAAGSVASPQIRNTGTVGGNICLNTRCWYYNQTHQWRKSRLPCFKRGGDYCYVVKVEGGKRCFALFMADTALMLTAFGARIRLESAGTSRTIALKDFFTDKGEKPNHLKPTELLTQIELPVLPKGTGSAYLRYAYRGAIDFPNLSAGVVVTIDPRDRVFKHASITIGGVGPSPYMANDAAAFLTDRKISDEVLEEAGRLAMNGIKPVTHMAVPAGYKRRIVPVYVKRALKKAIDTARADTVAETF